MRRHISSTDAPHLSEKVFRKYEAVIYQAVSRWPDPTSWTPRTLAPSTFASQLRSAITGAVVNRYATAINLDKLKEMWDVGKVLIRGESVLFTGPSAEVVPDADSRFLLELIEPSVDQLNALAGLYLARVTERPSRIIPPLPPWQPPPGVSIARQPDNTFLML